MKNTNIYRRAGAVSENGGVRLLLQIQTKQYIQIQIKTQIQNTNTDRTAEVVPGCMVGCGNYYLNTTLHPKSPLKICGI